MYVIRNRNTGEYLTGHSMRTRALDEAAQFDTQADAAAAIILHGTDQDDVITNNQARYEARGRSK